MEEGRPAYHRALLLKVWLYAYALGVTSACHLEQRVREDLGEDGPDGRGSGRRPGGAGAQACRDGAQELGWRLRPGGFGAGPFGGPGDRPDRASDPSRCDPGARRVWGTAGGAETERRVEKAESAAQWQEEIPRCLEGLRKSGLKRRSETDPDSRFLRDRKGFTLGYTAEVAVSEDHLLVEQRVGQNATDNATLVPLVETVERRCRERPQKVSAAAVYLSHIIRRGVSMRVPPWSFHGLRATAGMIAFLLLCPSAWGESLTRSDQQSTTGSEQQRDHLWYSQVETRFGGEGLRLFLHREPGPDLLTSPFPTVGCMLPQSQERRRDLKPVLVLDYCYEHGEVKVLSYRPPSPPGDSKSGAGPGASPGVSKDAAAPPASAAHHWYSQLAPEVTSQGLSLRIPIAMSGNWCDIWPEKVAAKNRELVRKASVEARLTIDLCLLHGEVKVLGYLPPGPDVMEALREGDWEAIRRHIRNDPIPSASP